MRKSLFFIALLIITTLCFKQGVSFAEIQIQASDIDVKTMPENPSPFDDVTITLSSYAMDINSADIEWLENGKTILEGIGKTSYAFKAGSANSIDSFTVKITPGNSIKTITKQISINPSEIDMLWEAVDAYTPPFYKGKALPSQEGVIKVTAVPNTSTLKGVSTKNMVYVWKVNHNVVSNASGYGKNTYIFKNDYLNNTEYVSVQASSPNGNFSSANSTDINIVSPNIIFYQKSVDAGIMYENALNDQSTLAGDEMTLVAEPYFLTMKNNDQLNYNWKINSDSISTPKNPRELTVRPESHGGYATISLSIENLNKLFQSVAQTLKLNL